MSTMTIGRLAKSAGVNVDTIRYYERNGLIPAPLRRASGYREYDAADVSRLRFILRAKGLGFTLAEIETGLPLLDDPAAAAPLLRDALLRKLEDIDARIAGLSALRTDLTRELARPGFGCPVLEEQAAA